MPQSYEIGEYAAEFIGKNPLALATVTARANKHNGRGDWAPGVNYACVCFERDGEVIEPMPTRSSVGGGKKGHSERLALQDAIEKAIEKGWITEQPLPLDTGNAASFSQYKDQLKKINVTIFTERGPCNIGDDNCQDFLDAVLSENHEVSYLVEYSGNSVTMDKRLEKQLKDVKQEYDNDFSPKKIKLTDSSSSNAFDPAKGQQIGKTFNSPSSPQQKDPVLPHKSRGVFGAFKPPNLVNQPPSTFSQTIPSPTSSSSSSSSLNVSNSQTHQLLSLEKKLGDFQKTSDPISSSSSSASKNIFFTQEIEEIERIKEDLSEGIIGSIEYCIKNDLEPVKDKAKENKEHLEEYNKIIEKFKNMSDTANEYLEDMKKPTDKRAYTVAELKEKCDELGTLFQETQGKGISFKLKMNAEDPNKRKR
jgi:hypothetical protein